MMKCQGSTHTRGSETGIHQSARRKVGWLCLFPAGSLVPAQSLAHSKHAINLTESMKGESLSLRGFPQSPCCV